jgi:undecaprenyl-diphosphatase
MFETIILGIIQGVTEFIPVSSSGHLVITQFFFSGASNHLFVEFLDVGTTIALFVYFRKRIWSICKDVFIKKNYNLFRNIMITALPAGIIGYLLSDIMNSSWFFASLVVVTVSIGLVGILMVVLEKIPKASSTNPDNLSPYRALAIGIAQIFALIPGVSRSGSTIIAGRLSGLSAADAAQYSFLAALPIMSGVMLKLFLGSSERAYLMDHLSVIVLSNVFAFIAGMIAVGFMMRYLSKHSLALFGWYRIALSAVLAVVILLQ